MDLKLRSRLLDKITFTDNGCWISHLAQSITTGYCQMVYRGFKQDAHRFSYEEFVGLIPQGMKVCHTCDVRNCINPAHLFLGSDYMNMRDAAIKGRTARKFSNDDVRVMREMRAAGHSYHEIAEKFNGTYFGVYAICRRWRRKYI
jgi:hypothetical protein